MIKINKISYSKVIFTLFTLLYLLNYALNGVLNQYLVLKPALILKSFEFWRILSFTFISANFENYFIFAIAFFYFAGRLENVFSKNIFLVSLVLLSFLNGLITTLLFFNTPQIFSGTEHLSLFVLFLFSFLNYNKKVNFFDKFSFPLSYLSTSFIIVWGIFKAWSIAFIGGSFIAEVLYPVSFSLIVAGVLYIRLLLIDKSNYTSNAVKEELSQTPLEKYSPAYVSHHDELNRIVKRIEDEANYSYMEEIELSEEKLNEILDKITETGHDSLTDSEKNFLELYSQKK